MNIKRRLFALILSTLLTNSMNCQINDLFSELNSFHIDSMINSVEQTDPNSASNSSLNLYYAIKYSKEGKVKKAIRYIDNSLKAEDSTTYLLALQFRGALYGLIGKYQKALKDFENAYNISKEPEFLNYLVEVSILSRDYHSALNYLKVFFDSDNNNYESIDSITLAHAYYFRAYSLRRTDSADSLVLADLHNALRYVSQEDSTGNFYIHLELVKVYGTDQGEFDRAIAHIEQAYLYAKDIEDIQELDYQMGKNCFFNEKYELAIEYSSRVQDGVFFGECLFFIARSLEYMNRFHEAVVVYDQIIDIKYKHALNLAYLHQGVCLYEIGAIKSAIKILKKAKRKWYSNDPMANYYLGMAYKSLGEQQKACDYFNETLDWVHYKEDHELRILHEDQIEKCEDL